ncbi:PREDICTED: cinnamoyl-CoA reductase 2-like [Camelina sativa]|uniref:Cinnamoyl-CoA reductase 2-like n=1 Tax=Camelina sativa TaxID=90675 RepID=A0ABM0WPU2_CAMSA|nr:PREDICTED: cinnamoyl-CoA reductase 2-like [Camelina sativa]
MAEKQKVVCVTRGYWPCHYLAKTLTEREALEWSKRNLADVVTLCGIKSLLSDQLYLVDVRDVTDALLLVYETPKAKGRYICNSHSLYTDSLMEKLKNMYPKRNFPESFTERTEKEVKEVRVLRSEKLQNLGWKFRPLEETIDDSVVSFEAAGDLPKPLMSSLFINPEIK